MCGLGSDILSQLAFTMGSVANCLGKFFMWTKVTIALHPTSSGHWSEIGQKTERDGENDAAHTHDVRRVNLPL